MDKQQAISLARNQALVGKTLDVLIEGQGDGISLGRSYRDAPEIDGMVLVEGEIPVGQMTAVRIHGAMAYDLTGVAAQAVAYAFHPGLIPLEALPARPAPKPPL
jgi:ribosomal protein S12 methylthiotransferase